MVVKAVDEAGTAAMELLNYYVWEDSSRKAQEMKKFTLLFNV